MGAIYKGLAIASTATGDQLYATDFHNARVDVFDSSFNLVTAPGGFVDKKIPHGYAPFGIQNINGAIFVTYARQDKAKVNDVPGATHGIVDMFDTSGNLVARVATKGALNAPWGLALAPSDFGTFSGDLLVGNFGNGMIHAYHQQANGRWKFRGPLRVSRSKALRIDGLWGLSFGNGGAAGPTNTLYFTAGPGGGSHGLFGSIQPAGGATTTPTTTPGASTTTTTAVRYPDTHRHGRRRRCAGVHARQSHHPGRRHRALGVGESRSQRRERDERERGQPVLFAVQHGV